MKRNSKNKFYLGEQGQLSIFFATNLIVVITFVALIINVGMFVRAKINLQNAVDSAAWAGAAVQARQLTNIAYLNWEMRNIYKEWMFKYYILGNLQISAVENGPASSGTAKYTMYSIPGSGGVDSYNFPSVCIEFGGTGGAKICRTYQVPGIPQFEASGIAGVDQATQAFVNAIEEQKNLDCSRRSDINFLATNLWAYNAQAGDPTAQSLTAAAPNIAADRMGAWPSAFELAIRIRNLEKVVNKKPYTQGVCFQPGSSNNINCSESIKTIQASSSTASNERVYKAYMSAYRNLGTVDRGNPISNNEMRTTFTLTELPVTTFLSENTNSLSNLLIPDGNREKYYLDLKLMPINLATFYTSFVSAQGTVNVNGYGNVNTSSGCDATKIALPVPGYPMGYVKNPDVLTYYAVKGEADFVGLFNPFNPPNIKLTAYAAAKPFGGRIGPHLFNTSGDDPSTITSRQTAGKFRSSGYVSGLDLSQQVDTQGNLVANSNVYVPGAPIPSNFGNIDFWVSTPSQPIGGWIDSSQIRFGIPNLAYDYLGGNPTGTGYNSGNNSIQIIKPGSGADPSNGLYQAELLSTFRSFLNNIGGNVGPNDIREGIMRARAPTKYEAFNYLIPLPDRFNSSLKVDSYGEPDQDENSSDNHYTLRVYAPLTGDTEDYHYANTSNILSVAEKYLSYQKPAIDKYRTAMNQVAQKISQIQTSQGAQVGQAAAKVISDINFTAPDMSAQIPTCNSMTGRFLFFYLGTQSGITTPENCPEQLKDQLQKYWSDQSSNNNKDFYNINYSLTFGDISDELKSALFSAYRPGSVQGANNGSLTNPYTGHTENMIRNFYSTKHISLRSVSNQNEDFYNQATSGFPTISEGNDSVGGFEEIGQASFKNTLNLQSLGIDIGNVDQ